MPDSLWLFRLYSARFLCPWDFPSKNTGMDFHFLIQGIFPIQGSKALRLHLLHCRQLLCHWATGEAQSCNIENLKILKYMKMIIMCVQVSSVTQSCTTQGDLMDCSTPGFPVHHQLPELTQTHVHWVGDAINPSHPLSSPSPAFNLSQYWGLFKWVSSLHQVARVLEFQLQHQSFQWMFRTDFC